MSQDYLGGLGGLTQQQIIDATNERQSALTRKNSDLRPRLQIRHTIPLDVAATDSQPYYIGDPFTAYYVEAATDSLTTVQIAFTSQEQHNMLNFTQLYLKDAATMKEPVKGAYLKWSAQSGKSITIIFYLNVDFKPGSYLSSISGAVVLNYGTGMTPATSVSVTSTATQIDVAQTLAKRRTIQVVSGSGVYLSGTSAVTGQGGTKPGIFIPVGGTYEVLNTGPIYGITDGSTSVVSLNTES